MNFDFEIITNAAVFILCATAAGMILYFLGLRFGKRKLKGWGVMVAVVPWAVIGTQVAMTYFGGPVVFRTSTPGPPGQTGTVAREFPYRVNERGSVQAIVLTPRARESARGRVSLHYRLIAPSGEVIGEGGAQLGAATADRWQPLRANLRTVESGDYKVWLEIPGPVDVVDVEITEREE